MKKIFLVLLVFALVQTTQASTQVFPTNDIWVISTRNKGGSITGTISFNNTNPDTITISGGNFLTANFQNQDYITVSGSNSNDGRYTISGAPTATTITLSGTDSLVSESNTANVTIIAPNIFWRDASNTYTQTNFTDPEGGSSAVATVTDTSGNRYVLFTSSLVECFSPPSYTTSCGSFAAGIAGYDMAMDANNNIWIASAGNATVKVFTRASGYASSSTYSIPTGYAYGIEADYNGDIWVPEIGATSDASKVSYLDAQNSYTATQIDLSTAAGGTGVVPVNVAVATNGDILVSAYGTSASVAYCSLAPYTTELTCTNNSGLWRSAVPYGRGGLFLLDASNSFAATKIANLQLTGGAIVDSSGKIFFTRNDNTRLFCKYESTPGAYSDCPGFGALTQQDNKYLTIGTAFVGANSGLKGLSVDANDDLWVVNGYDKKLYCLDHTNSYDFTGTGNCPAPTNVAPVEANLPLPMGDPTGNDLYRLANVITLEDAVDVTAIVDPIIALSVSSASCPLGVLSTGSVTGCNTTVNVKTNAANGWNIYLDDTNDTGFTRPGGPSTDIPMTTGTLSAGTAGAGWSWGIAFQPPDTSVPYNGSNCSVHTGFADFGRQNCEAEGGTWTVTCPGNNSVLDIGTSPLAFVTGGGTVPLMVQTANGFDVDLCFSATISPLTPAGSYSHTVTVTSVGSF